MVISTNVTSTNLRKPRVLAVDDLPANLVVLEAVLMQDFELILASSGAQAIEILQCTPDIDLILMDLQMPGMDGFEAAKRIKKLESGKDIPIIFITAVYKEEPFVKRGYEVGGIDYFSKPFDPDILKMKVGIYASFRQKADILKERERQIRVSEELLRAGRKLSSTLESLPVGVLIADVGGRISQTNEEVIRICRAIDVIEQDDYGAILGWWDVEGRMIKEESGPLGRALQTGETSHNHLIPIRCVDGTPKTILCSASPLKGLDGQIVGAVIVIQDVSHSRKIEEDLEQRITRLISLGVELERVAIPADGLRA